MSAKYSIYTFQKCHEFVPYLTGDKSTAITYWSERPPFDSCHFRAAGRNCLSFASSFADKALCQCK